MLSVLGAGKVIVVRRPMSPYLVHLLAAEVPAEECVEATVLGHQHLSRFPGHDVLAVRQVVLRVPPTTHTYDRFYN